MSKHPLPTLILLLVLLLLLLVAISELYSANRQSVNVGRFSQLDPGPLLPVGWLPFNLFRGNAPTQYALVLDEGGVVLKGDSNAGSSGLLCPIYLDPTRFPYLRWRWKISGVAKLGDVRQKQGDDAPARLLVMFADDPPVSLWEQLKQKTLDMWHQIDLSGKALCYVWANRIEPETHLPSPYSAKIQVVVIRNEKNETHRWHEEERNVLEDYHAAFGTYPRWITAVAVLTDADNTDTRLVGYYGDIAFAPNRQGTTGRRSRP